MKTESLPLAVILVVPLCFCSVLVAGVLVTHRDVNIFVQIRRWWCWSAWHAKTPSPGRRVCSGNCTGKRQSVFRGPRSRGLAAAAEANLDDLVCLRIRCPPRWSSPRGAGADTRPFAGHCPFFFSGMLGVTMFGIFLTPVFFYVILELGATRLFLAVAATGWLGSTVLGGALGLASGYLFARLGIVALPWALFGGACSGVLAVLAIVGIHRQIRMSKG